MDGRNSCRNKAAFSNLNFLRCSEGGRRGLRREVVWESHHNVDHVWLSTFDQSMRAQIKYQFFLGVQQRIDLPAQIYPALSINAANLWCQQFVRWLSPFVLIFGWSTAALAELNQTHYCFFGNDEQRQWAISWFVWFVITVYIWIIFFFSGCSVVLLITFLWWKTWKSALRLWRRGLS